MGREILVFGDVNVDVMAPLAGLLIPGGDNLPPTMRQELGGVAANVAVTLSKFGVGVRLAGAVGRDAFGDSALGALERQGVDVTAVARVEAPTGLIVIPVDPGGRRTIIGSRGANEFAPQRAPEECLAGVQAAHLVGYSFLSAETAGWAKTLIAAARARGIHVSLDAGLAPSQKAREAILGVASQLDVLFVGIEEMEALTGKVGHAAEEAIAQCGAGLVVLKRGEAGCQFLSAAADGRWWMIPPVEVEGVDTTGAGDAFAAGFLYARLRGWATADAVALGNACGAATAATLGAGEKMPGPEDVMRVLEQQDLAGRESSAAARLLRLLRAKPSSANVKVSG